MEPSFALPDTDRLAGSARAADLLDDTADAVADTMSDAIDVATRVADEAIELAGPTVVALGPRIGRFVWGHKKWLVVGFAVVAVLVVMQKRRDRPSADVAEERPSKVFSGSGPTNP